MGQIFNSQTNTDVDTTLIGQLQQGNYIEGHSVSSDLSILDTELKSTNDFIGDATLITVSHDITDAINELKTTLDNLSAKVGNVPLKTEHQNLSQGINDLYAEIVNVKDIIESVIGDISILDKIGTDELTTVSKNLSGAVNELNNKISDLSTRIDNIRNYTAGSGINISGTTISTKTCSYTPEITQSTPNSYKLGTITICGTSFDIYGKDTPKSTLSDLGITASASELNYSRSLTGNIQTQLNSKQPIGSYATQSDLAAKLDKSALSLSGTTLTISNT